MTRTLSNRLVASALAATLMLSAWIPTLTIPADAQFAATSVAFELA